MGSRNVADVAPTASSMALNAYIFGYGGHSILTPHEALKQLWWTDQRIEAKVTRPYINSKFRESERKFLDRRVCFGEGLTDGTYMDWILERAKRLFLILAEVGIPDQILGCIDFSWDDEDLPLTLDNVKDLELSLEYDESLNRSFYEMQFVYLLRELRQGEHIDYGPKEHIPMEHVNTLPPAVSLQSWDRIHFPKRRDEIYTRRKYPLSNKHTGSCSTYENFRRDVLRAQKVSHKHIAAVWGSYTFENAGYVISDFVGEHTLQSFIAHRTSPQYLRVAATDRPGLLCVWLHCLSDALAFIHHEGLAHGAITPSNIIIDRNNRIAFADIGSLRIFQGEKNFSKLETYEYAAPEQQICRTPHSLKLSSPISSRGAIKKLRRMRSTRSDSSTRSSSNSSFGSNRASTTISAPAIHTPSRSTSGVLTVAKNAIPLEVQYSDRPLPMRPLSPTVSSYTQELSVQANNAALSNQRSGHGLLRSSVYDADLLVDLPRATPQQSDIFSFACVMLDIMTFLLKGKLTDFAKHRSTSVKSLGNTANSHIDSSFHENPDRIHSWIDHLLDECGKFPGLTYRGFPTLLELVRRMMAQNAASRPSAIEVRYRLTETLIHECGMPILCCTDCNWGDLNPRPYAEDVLRWKIPFKPTEDHDGHITPMFAAHQLLPASAQASPSPPSFTPRTSRLRQFLLNNRPRKVPNLNQTKRPSTSQSLSQSHSTDVASCPKVHSSSLPSTVWSLRKD
nr:serine/threonine-protein kinase pknb [Quercus suber]